MSISILDALPNSSMDAFKAFAENVAWIHRNDSLTKIADELEQYKQHQMLGEYPIIKHIKNPETGKELIEIKYEDSSDNTIISK